MQNFDIVYFSEVGVITGLNGIPVLDGGSINLNDKSYSLKDLDFTTSDIKKVTDLTGGQTLSPNIAGCMKHFDDADIRSCVLDKPGVGAFAYGNPMKSGYLVSSYLNMVLRNEPSLGNDFKDLILDDQHVK